METDIPPVDTGGTGELSKANKITIGLAVPGTFVAVVAALKLIKSMLSWYRKRRTGSQGGTSGQRQINVEIRVDAAGEVLLNMTNRQAENNRQREGAIDFEVDQSPNCQSEINAAGEGADQSELHVDVTELDQSPAEMSGLSEGCGDRQADEADSRVEDMETSNPSVPSAENVPLQQQKSSGCGDRQADEADSRVEDMETSNSSVPSAESVPLQQQKSSGNTGLTDVFFMDLAKEIGSEWKAIAIRLGFTRPETECIEEENRKVMYRTLYVLQTWHQRTPIKNEKEKVFLLCNALTTCDRDDLSEKVKYDLGFGL